MSAEQFMLPLGPLRNSHLFSNHWLDNRLTLEPELVELRQNATAALKRLGELWQTQRDLLPKLGNEAALEQAFIQPVLQALGWTIFYQTHLQGRKPDYALFLDAAAHAAAVNAGRNSDEFWRNATVVADAKAWSVALDRKEGDTAREFPPQQIEWYLDRSRLAFGILTNGRKWRLVPREREGSQPRFQTYFESDIGQILDEWNRTDDIGRQAYAIEDFLRFFLFFGPEGHRPQAERGRFIERALKGSSEYRVGVGEGLRHRTFEALRLCIEGFLSLPANGLYAKIDLERCQQQSFIVLYRLLFILFGEDRRLLPYHRNRTYTNNRSLGRLRTEIADRLSKVKDQRGDDYDRNGTDVWDQLCDLFDLIDRGHKSYGVPPYNGGLFDDTQHPLLRKWKLPDWHLARLIDQLGRSPDPERPAAGLFRVDYRDLAIQHLGDIYEGMLELRPRLAAERMVLVVKRTRLKTEERIIAATAPVPEGFETSDVEYAPDSIYLSTDKGERRATGSYYTPDNIVDYLIEGTLGPICRDISANLDAEIAKADRLAEQSPPGSERDRLAAEIARLRTEFDARILALRVVDPAMGSGHFLLRACRYLAEEIATHPHASDAPVAVDGTPDDASTLSHWKRMVVERCLYGADMNPLAVELAKLALWLETVASDRPLTFLDHHLRHGNSLVGAEIARLATLPAEEALLALPVVKLVEDQLPAMLGPLADIRRTRSDTVEAVKEKGRLYSRFESTREPFQQLADLWCAAFKDAKLRGVPADGYRRAAELVGKPRAFAAFAADPAQAWLPRTVAAARAPDMAALHWELAFPEVFFGPDGRLARPGFDAVIGNPPYEVLSELESGRDLSVFRRFLEHQPAYRPSFRGKNNLYKLFVCRAVQLLADGGRLGFITPMPILGDDQAADMRKLLTDAGEFTGIEAFPQKDDPARRVFREAKLSTAAWTWIKGKASDGRPRPFRSRTHAGATIDDGSPALTLTSADLGLYDPENRTIVSCGQEDWDLAVRMMKTGRLARLRDFAETFQGEVNETNDRNADRVSYDRRDGPEVIRGAHLCLYALREASQGRAVFVKLPKFLDRKGTIDGDQKAFHHKHKRIGFQRKSPQNNFRRLIAAAVPEGTFLLESVSYVPAHRCNLPLELVNALLNSNLCEWFFRIGSTNAMVGEYQFNNLPCPVFGGG